MGSKTETDVDGIECVTFVWCLVCAKNEKQILQHPKCRGAMKEAMSRFAKDTNNVMKLQSLGI